jgi:predicted signal transduction protein with EAL and GGDEF domain
MSCSIGVSVFPDHGVDGESLIKNADGAMYSAKEAGRNVVRFFTDEMNAEATERLTLERTLRLALDKKEFFLAFQPQMEIATGEIVGFEALIRWQHPELGLIPPDKFIPIAENNGLILQIGEWVPINRLRAGAKMAGIRTFCGADGSECFCNPVSPGELPYTHQKGVTGYRTPS